MLILLVDHDQWEWQWDEALEEDIGTPQVNILQDSREGFGRMKV